VICSDGVIEGLWDHHIDELVRQPDADPARLLVEQAVANSGADNTTAVVISILDASA
jgi:protein phosphatase